MLGSKLIRQILLSMAVVAVLLVFVTELFVHSVPIVESLDVSAHFATLLVIVVGVLWLGTKIDLLHQLVNSRMTGILELQALKSFAEGVKAESDRAKAAAVPE